MENKYQERGKRCVLGSGAIPPSQRQDGTIWPLTRERKRDNERDNERHNRERERRYERDV